MVRGTTRGGRRSALGVGALCDSHLGRVDAPPAQGVTVVEVDAVDHHGHTDVYDHRWHHHAPRHLPTHLSQVGAYASFGVHPAAQVPDLRLRLQW